MVVIAEDLLAKHVETVNLVENLNLDRIGVRTGCPRGRRLNSQKGVFAGAEYVFS